MNKDRVFGLLHEDCSGEMLEASLRLADYVFSNRSDIHHLTFTRLGQIANSKDPRLVLSLVQYLTGAKVQLLDAKFELIVDDRISILDNEDLAEAERTNVLNDPETGEPVQDYKSKVFPYFVPGRAVTGGSL